MFSPLAERDFHLLHATLPRTLSVRLIILFPLPETSNRTQAGGLIVSLHVPFLSGGTVVLMRKFDLAGFCLAVQTYKVKVRSGLFRTRDGTNSETQGGLIAPPMALALAKSPIVDYYDMKSLTWLFSGAAPLSGELQRTSLLLELAPRVAELPMQRHYRTGSSLAEQLCRKDVVRPFCRPCTRKR